MRFLPILLCIVSVPAMAQITVRNGVNSQQVDQFLHQMQGALSGGKIPAMTPAQQLKLQQGLVLTQVYNCTENVVGKENVDAFINKMKATGKQVEAYCKQAQPTEARALAVNTLKANANNPTAIAARNCYYEYKPQIEPLLASQNPADIANYERWLQDPALAEREVKESDICKGSPSVQAAPTSPINTQSLQDVK